MSPVAFSVRIKGGTDAEMAVAFRRAAARLSCVNVNMHFHQLPDIATVLAQYDKRSCVRPVVNIQTGCLVLTTVRQRMRHVLLSRPIKHVMFQ
jgi:hypothetical protein